MVIAILLEILACFLLSIALLHRYCDMVNSNIVTVVGVFISWFFSFIIIFLLPADLTSTAYRACKNSIHVLPNVTTTTNPPHNVTTTLNAGTGNIVNLTADHKYGDTLNYLTDKDNTLLVNDVNHYMEDNQCSTPWNLVPESSLTQAWRFIYWTSQILTWLVLPIMQSYSKAGEFNNTNKLKYALRANIIYYSSFGAIFVVLLLYVIIRNGFPTLSNLKVILVSSSNTWGLFLLVVLLGYGLVELPRFLLDRSKYSQCLNRLYFEVASVNAEKCEADEKLDDVLEEVHQAISILGASEHNYLKPYLNKIVDRFPPDLKRRLNTLRRRTAASNASYQPDGSNSKYNDYDIKTMVQLNRKVINSLHQHGQVNCKWRHLIEEVIEWEDVARNQTDHESLSTRKFSSTIPKNKSIFLHMYTPTIEWYWKCIVRVWILRGTGTIMAVMSLAVFWSEIAFPLATFSPRLSIFALFVDTFEKSQKYFELELFSIISIGYLAVCAFYTVFHMKIFNIYYLAPNKQTDEYSLIFSGMLLCRLTAPLCLNYLSLTHRDSHGVNSTSFTSIMGTLELIPLVSNGLNVLLPLCVSAICLAIYFNFGSHVLHSLGFDRFIEDDEITLDLIQTGRELVRREKGKLLRIYDPGSVHRSTQAKNISSFDLESQTTSKPVETQNESNTRRNLDSPNSQSSSSSSSGFSRSSLIHREAM